MEAWQRIFLLACAITATGLTVTIITIHIQNARRRITARKLNANLNKKEQPDD